MTSHYDVLTKRCDACREPATCSEFSRCILEQYAAHIPLPPARTAREQDTGTDILALALAAVTGVLNGNDDTRDFAKRCICILEDADLDRLREAFGWLDTECCEELGRRHS